MELPTEGVAHSDVYFRSVEGAIARIEGPIVAFEGAKGLFELLLGGIPFLKALASPIAGVRFCPTGSVTAKSAPDYLALPNVVCVGGSWVAPDAMVKEGRWAEIEALAREASKLGR